MSHGWRQNIHETFWSSGWLEQSSQEVILLLPAFLPLCLSPQFSVSLCCRLLGCSTVWSSRVTVACRLLPGQQAPGCMENTVHRTFPLGRTNDSFCAFLSLKGKNAFKKKVIAQWLSTHMPWSIKLRLWFPGAKGNPARSALWAWSL